MTPSMLHGVDNESGSEIPVEVVQVVVRFARKDLSVKLHRQLCPDQDRINEAPDCGNLPHC